MCGVWVHCCVVGVKSTVRPRGIIPNGDMNALTHTHIYTISTPLRPYFTSIPCNSVHNVDKIRFNVPVKVNAASAKAQHPRRNTGKRKRSLTETRENSVPQKVSHPNMKSFSQYRTLLYPHTQAVHGHICRN